MNTAATTIISRLNEVFAPMDAEVLAAAQEWAKGRAQAIREFKASDEYQAIRFDPYRLYARLHGIAGGKTWYTVFNGNSLTNIAEFVMKNCAAVAAKRNASIATKLAKAGVTEVISEEFTHTHDGFNGVFVVGTDAGRKTVTVDTIRAGGYNIQCLHLRVLTKVR